MLRIITRRIRVCCGLPGEDGGVLRGRPRWQYRNGQGLRRQADYAYYFIIYYMFIRDAQHRRGVKNNAKRNDPPIKYYIAKVIAQLKIIHYLCRLKQTNDIMTLQMHVNIMHYLMHQALQGITIL